MACCSGSLTWECCYPDTCGCDTCCCQGSSCSGGCSSSGSCGVGACCTCNSSSWGYAWKATPPSGCSLTPGCGYGLLFTNDGLNLYEGYREDTHNQNASSIADLTKALFMQMAPLSQGVISSAVVFDNPYWEC